MKVVTVCGCGLGTCLLLKMTCEKACKELGISDVEVIHGDLGSLVNTDCDFFVITSDMEKQFVELGKKFVAVTNVASVEEMVEKLKPIVQS